MESIVDEEERRNYYAPYRRLRISASLTLRRSSAPALPFSRSPRLAAAVVAASLLVLLLIAGCGRDVHKVLEQASDAWDSGDYKESARLYEQYIEQNPAGAHSADARFQLANIYYFNLRRYDQARTQYTAFLEQDASNANAPLARERLAEVLGEMGRSYEAIAEYENLNPQDGAERRRIRLRIADLYFAQKNYSQALTEYEKVVEIVPYDELSEQAYLREASIYHIARGQYQQALPVYEKLASETRDPKVHLRAQYGLADCYAGLYRFDEAIRVLKGVSDQGEQKHLDERIAELSQRRREAAQVQNGLQR